MLIVRSPVRISFGGGGTDLAAYADRYEGLVLSTAINRYCYVLIRAGESDGVQISSADMRLFNSRRSPESRDEGITGNGAPVPADVLRIPWAVLRHFGVSRGLDIFLASEVPPGTGLGSSSAITVALVQALATLLDRPLSRADLAETAARIEIDDLKMPIGRQDQYAAAFGGLNLITFGAQGQGPGHVEPLHLGAERVRQLEQHLMLFFTGATHNSAEILRAQQADSGEDRGPVVEALHAIKALALEMRTCLLAGDWAGFGCRLDQAWEHKKQLAAGITTPMIDNAYERARALGAWGGKITGAGGGGFLMLCCPLERQIAVTAELAQLGLHRMAFRFDRAGAGVLLNSGTIDITAQAPGTEY